MDFIKNLFVSQKPITEVQNDVNNLNRREGETYTAYGTRICAKVNGAEASLVPCLQRIFLAEKKLQSQDEQLQNKKRSELASQISEIESKIGAIEADKDLLGKERNDNQEEYGELQIKLSDAKNQDGENNKMAYVKLRIGLLILLILSLYLFIFYSSTFYSAFFKQFTFDTNVAEAMFDQRAIPNALHNGIGGLIFILCAPIIFMGLGYILHYYASEKGKIKYFKISVILLITFMFDCILAYLIAEKIYNTEILTKMGDFPDFNLSMAVKDINVWAVIFCGFITYMIWGFVFDLTISAYEEIKTNKKTIERIENEIKRNRESKALLDNKENEIKKELINLEKQKQTIQGKLSLSTYFYDETIIKTALTNFFTGWVTIMQPLGHSAEHQQNAKTIFEQTINSLFNK